MGEPHAAPPRVVLQQPRLQRFGGGGVELPVSGGTHLLPHVERDDLADDGGGLQESPRRVVQSLQPAVDDLAHQRRHREGARLPTRQPSSSRVRTHPSSSARSTSRAKNGLPSVCRWR